MSEGVFVRGYPAPFDDIVSCGRSLGLAPGQGYLAQRPGVMTGDFMIITPQGKRWFENRESVPKSAVGPSPLGPPTPPAEVSGKGGTGKVSIDDLAREMGVNSQQILDLLGNSTRGASWSNPVLWKAKLRMNYERFFKPDRSRASKASLPLKFLQEQSP